MADRTPTLMLCVGATKAGTSWLHDYLSAHPQVHLRSIKELHYFDAIERDDWRFYARETRRWADTFRDRLSRIGGPRRDIVARKLADREEWLAVLERATRDDAAYLRYLTAGAGAARVAGETTPAYSLLSEDALRRMAGIAPDVRVIYLLRDPVARLWSHVRMIVRRRTADGEVRPWPCENVLSRTIAGDEGEIALRCDYAGALARLRAAVPRDRLLVMTMERMLQPAGQRALTDFIGLAPLAGDAGRRVHEGRSLAMTADQRARARDWLAPQYAAVADALGGLPPDWDPGPSAARSGGQA